MADEVPIRFPNYSTDGTCINCSKCCPPFIAITAVEEAAIKKYIIGKDIVAEDLGDLCPFRDVANDACLIYDVRPTICSVFNCWDSLTYEALAKARIGAEYNVVGKEIKSMYDIFFK